MLGSFIATCKLTFLVVWPSLFWMVLTSGLQYPRMLVKAVKVMDLPTPHGHHLAIALHPALPTQVNLLMDPSPMAVRVSTMAAAAEAELVQAQAPALPPLHQVVGTAMEAGLDQTTQLLRALQAAIPPTPILVATAAPDQAPALEARAAASAGPSRPSLVQLALSMCRHSPCWQSWLLLSACKQMLAASVDYVAHQCFVMRGCLVLFAYHEAILFGLNTRSHVNAIIPQGQGGRHMEWCFKKKIYWMNIRREDNRRLRGSL